MDARDLREHLAWCRKMAGSRNFADLDGDDVFSIALEAAWKSSRLVETSRIVPTRNCIFKRDVQDLRRRLRARKRSIARCRRFHVDGEGDVESFPDRSLDDPLDVLCAREAVAPLVAFQEEHGRPPAEPCVRCGTLGGLVRGDGTRPRRTDGLCHRCYQNEWNARRQRAKDAAAASS